MITRIFCGKGGVGKTNSAVSLGFYLSKQRNRKVAIVDYDGGHSVASTLGFACNVVPNIIHAAEHNLAIVVVENTNFISISEAKRQGHTLEQYLWQFPGSLGILPLSDMVNEFFGVLTDVATLQKFAILVDVLTQLQKEKYTDVIIDVEPTAGLERLLTNTGATVRSLHNLQKQGVAALAVIGVKWPDIKQYLKGDYIRNADQHCMQIERTAGMLRSAYYFIVCTPEAGPVNQTFEVRKIIESFGARVHGYVVNNIRGEEHEKTVLVRLNGVGVPITRIERKHSLHDPKIDRGPILLEMGKVLARECL